MATSKKQTTRKSSGSKSSSGAKKKTSYTSSSYSAKKVVRNAAKYAKKNPKGAAVIIVVALVLVAAAAAGYWYYTNYINVESYIRLIGPDVLSVALDGTYEEQGAKAVYKNKDISDEITVAYYKGTERTSVTGIDTSSECTYYAEYSVSHSDFSGSVTRTINVVKTEPISINFLELGNIYTGDCTYIKAGNTDILIDAGSRQNSAATIESFINNYVTDGKLEYVICTHAHQDHIAGFVGSNGSSVFDDYKIGTLIDFALTGSSSGIYKQYVSKRDSRISSGDIEHHYTARECIEGTNGAKSLYEVAAGITMKILDQRYYYETTSDENNYSVCALFTQGSYNYLFTGDLEKSGEESLVEKNSLPHVQLFKGGHHGSYTANTDALLNVIQPETICICCCAGSDEYTDTPANMFPAQDSVNRMAKWTKEIYVTTVVSSDSKGYASMNGNITFSSDNGSSYEVHGSNNDTILKDTDWFRSNRTWPSDGVQ